MRQLFWLYIYLPFSITKNQFLFTSVETIAKNFVLLSFAIGVAVAEYVLFYRFWQLIGSVPFGYALLLPRFFSFMGSYLFTFLAYSSLLTALSSFYRSEDLGFLLSTSIRLPCVILYKWFDVAVRSSSTLIFLSLPPMIALANILNVSFSFYFVYVLAVLSISSIAVCLGVWIAMLMALIFPTKRIHQTVAVLGLVVAALIIIGIRFLHLETLWSEEALQNPLIVLLQQEPSTIWNYVPGKLFSLSLIPIINGSTEYTWIFVSILISFLFLFFTITASKHLFLYGWWRTREQNDPQIKSKGWKSKNPIMSILPVKIQILIWKDYLIFKRDPAIWTQLFMMIPLAIIYIINLTFLPIRGSELIHFFAVANVGIISLIIAAVSARFLFPVASREGSSVWIPAVSPTSSWTIILQKILFSVPPVLGLGILLILISGYLLSISFYLSLWCLTFGIMLLVLICLNAVLLGFCFPMYDHKHLLEVSLGKGSFIFMGISMIQICTLMYWAYCFFTSKAVNSISFTDPTLIGWLTIWMSVSFSLFILANYRWKYSK
jgi:ABC-2 type transport system permease protein